MPPLLTYLLFGIYAVTILGIVLVIITDNRNPLKTVPWIVVLLFAPVVGLLFYFFFGQNLSKRRILSRRMRKRIHMQLLEAGPDERKKLPAQYRPLARLLGNAGHSIPLCGSRITPYVDGASKMEALLGDIAAAHDHIHLQYYILNDDTTGLRLRNALMAKAREGVEIRILYDDVGSSSVHKRFFEEMRRAGIEVRPFLHVKFPLFTSKVNYRNHRKIAVIDGRTGYIGGMNIADYYINGLPKIGTWRDMHMRIEGDAVNDLQEIFLTIWNKETKQNIGGEIYFPQHEDSTNIVVAIVDRTPKKNSRMLSHAYAMSIYSAQKNVHIVNPYFVPTSSIKKALNRTIDRGVNVTIMVSSASDIPFTPDAALYKLHKLMKRGATVYMYNGGFHHSKIMMIDDLFCTVGTANLNSRSLRYDYETNAFIFDKKTTAELNTMFRNDIEHCTQLTPEFWKKRSPWKKFVGWFANLFTPFL